MSDLADWVQAVVAGVAILASGFIYTRTILYEGKLDRRDENRRRLDITTKRWPPAGLQLDLRYMPEFTHIGMFARIKLLSPMGTTLAPMNEVPSVTANQGSHTTLQLGGVFVGDSGVVRLVGHGPGQPYTGSMLMRPSVKNLTEVLQRARISVTVETDAGEILLKTNLDISPTDQVQSFWEMSPPEGSSI